MHIHIHTRAKVCTSSPPAEMVVTADCRLVDLWVGIPWPIHGDTAEKLIPTLVLALRVRQAKIVMVAADADHSNTVMADCDVHLGLWRARGPGPQP
jgi:hypothetical protein